MKNNAVTKYLQQYYNPIVVTDLGNYYRRKVNIQPFSIDLVIDHNGTRLTYITSRTPTEFEDIIFQHMFDDEKRIFRKMGVVLT